MLFPKLPSSSNLGQKIARLTEPASIPTTDCG